MTAKIAERPQHYRFHQGDRVLPFAPEEYEARLEGLRELMQVHGVEACVFTSMHNIAYYLQLMAGARDAIRGGRYAAFVNECVAQWANLP